MKDTLKFAGSTLLLLVTLIMINMIFVQSLTGDYDWFNILLAVIFTLVVLAAAVYDGLNRGAKDVKYTRMMERQMTERGYVMTEKEKERLFKPSKGFIAGFIAGAPSIVLSILSMILNVDGTNWVMNLLTRTSLGHFLGIFAYAEALTPWIYLPLALVYPLVLGIANTNGPKMWDYQVKQMEKAKREKRRKVNRRRKKKTV